MFHGLKRETLVIFLYVMEPKRVLKRESAVVAKDQLLQAFSEVRNHPKEDKIKDQVLCLIGK